MLSNVLMEFPVKEIKVNIPRWILSLEQGHWLKSALYDAICRSCGQLHRISHVAAQLEQIEECEQIQRAQITGMDLGHGKVMLSITRSEERRVGNRSGDRRRGRSAALLV